MKSVLDFYKELWHCCQYEWMTDRDRDLPDFRNAVKQNLLRARPPKPNAAYACAIRTFAVVAVELLERDVEGGRGDAGDGAAFLPGGLPGSVRC